MQIVIPPSNLIEGKFVQHLSPKINFTQGIIRHSNKNLTVITPTRENESLLWPFWCQRILGKNLSEKKLINFSC